MKRLRQRGAALLAAMLTVTMVATFAAAAMWQQWRSIEIEAAERWRMQSEWLLTGALDWARLILREDYRAGGADHLAEPWAVPLQEARLSTFLAADPNNNVSGDSDSDAANVFLSGEITDMQAKLNVSNLVQAGAISTTWQPVFGRLFEVLGLPPSQLNRLAANWRFAADLDASNLSGGKAPLLPDRVEQLAWLGLPPETVNILAPHVTVLSPTNVLVNLNTASAEVIYAATALTLADAQRVVAMRGQQHFKTLTEASQRLGLPPTAFPSATVTVNTSYFEIRGRIRREEVVIEQRSIVHRNGPDVRTLHREHAVLQNAAPR